MEKLIKIMDLLVPERIPDFDDIANKADVDVKTVKDLARELIKKIKGRQ